MSSRQAELLNAFIADKHHLMKKSGGSACNTVIAAANFGARTFFSGKVAADDDGEHFVGDLADSGVVFIRLLLRRASLESVLLW